MPNSVDTRIVEMQFDNAKFEKNIRQSMNSLNELDRALQMKDAGKGFNELEKNVNKVDFSKMEKSLSFLEYRASAVGMTMAKIIDKTTDKIGGLFSKIESMTIGQIKSGGMARALKLEHANFMLDGILKDAEKVKDIMDNAVSPAVDGTAYGLDAAANAASQFVASGIQDVEKLKVALTGISGVAAMSGSEYEDIAQIFTKVAASGRMMGDEVMQLSVRGINAQAELAKYLHKTVAEVQEMQKKGQISFEIFSNAMNDAFGEQAKKANETYTGAMSNLKAALSRIGADFATPYINNMRDIFNALRLTVNDVRKALQPIVKLYTDGITKLKNFIVEFTKNRDLVLTYTTAIKNVYLVINMLASALHTIRDGFIKAFPEGMIGIIAEASGRLTEFLYRLEFSKSTLEAFTDIFSGLFSIIKLFGYLIGKLTGYSGPLLSGANDLLGLIVRILGVIGKLITMGTDFIINNTKSINVIKALKTALLLAVAAFIKIGSTIASFIKKAKDLPIVQDIFNGLYDAAVGLADFALPLLAGAAGAVVSAFSYLINLGKSGFFSDLFNKVTNKIKDFHNILSKGEGAVSSFANIFTGGFKKLPWTITACAKSIDEFKTSVGDTGKRGGLLGAILGISDVFTKLKDGALGIGTWLGDEAKKFGIARGLIVGTGAALIAFLSQAAGLARNFKKAFAGIPDVISALKNNLNANIFDIKAKALILGLAVAIGSLTVALVALSMVDSNKLKVAAGALSLVVAVMAAAGIAINRLGGGFKGFQAVSISFVSFAGAIGVLILSLATLAEIKIDEVALLKRIGMLGLIMAELGIVVIAMTKWSKPFSVLLGSGFMLSFAFSVGMLVKSLGILANMDIDKINRALPALLKMMGGLALISAACTMLSPFAGTSFIAIVGGVTAFILAITGLAEILNVDKFYYIHTLLVDIYNMTKTWLIIFAIAELIKQITNGFMLVKRCIDTLSGTVGEIKSVGKDVATVLAAPLKAFGDAAVIVSLVAGFILVAAAIKQLGKLPEEQFRAGCEKAVIIAAGLATFLGAVMLLQRLILGKNTKFLDGLEKVAISMAAAVLALAVSLKIISEIKEDSLVRAIAAVSGMFAVVSLLMVLLGLLNKDNKVISMGIKTALAISVLVTALTLSVGLLSMLAEEDWTPIIAAAGSVTLLMLGVAAICLAMGQVKWAPALTASIGIIAVLAAVAGAMLVIQSIKFDENYTNVFAALVLTIGYMVVLFALLSQLDPKKALVGGAALLALTVVFGGFAYIFTIIQDIDFNKLLPNLVAIMASISVLSIIVAGLGAFAKESLLGVVALAGITLLMWGIAEVAKIIASIDTKMLIDNLTTLGIAITILGVVCALLGGIIYGTGGTAALILLAGAAALLVFAGVMYVYTQVGSAFGQSLKDIAEGLGSFAPAITALGEALASFASQNMNGVLDNLVAAVVTLAGLSFVAGDIQNLGNGMESLGNGLEKFTTYAGDLNDNLVMLGDAVPKINEYFTQLNDTFKNLTTLLSDAIEALSDDKIYNLVSSLANAMKEHLENDFNSVGRLAIGHVVDGMNSEIEETVPPIMGNFVRALKSGSFNGEELTSLGAELAEYLVEGFVGTLNGNGESGSRMEAAAKDAVGGVVTGIQSGFYLVDKVGAEMGQVLEEGFRGPNGIDAHSDSWKMILAAKDAVGGVITGIVGGFVETKTAGAQLGDQLVQGYKEGVKEGEPDVINQIKNISYNAQAYLDGNPIYQKIIAVLEDHSGLLDQGGSGGPVYRMRDAKGRTTGYMNQKEINDARTEGRKKTAAYMEQAAAAKKAETATKNETKAMGGNSKAAKSNTKAKEENEEANDGKTEAIDEETESLGEEEQATNDNEEALRAMAEEIEVVTEKYKELNAWTGWVNKFKFTNKMFNTMGQAWSKSFKDIKRASDGTEEVIKHNWHEVSYQFNKARDTISKTTDKIAKGLYAFDETSGKMEKKYTKRLKKVSGSLKSITNQVQKSGKMIAKVYEGYAKVYTKAGNGKVDKMVVRLTKNVKNLSKWVKSAKDFVNSFNDDVKGAQYVEDFTENLRKIENFFVKRQNMPKKVQDYLGNILSYFNKDFKQSMNLMAKQIDGIGDYWKKGTQSTAYVADAYTQLAATLYDGSEAANQYWTEIARMQFLVENGLEPPEKLEELYVGYLERAVEALKEYKAQLDETIAGQFNPFEQFDEKMEDQTKNLLDCLESQIIGFERWGEGLQALSSRGADFNLIKELADQGVESYGIMRNLLSMTASELALYNKYYRMIDTVKQKASDSALAAVANARTNANLRAAAKSGKLSQKQMQKQRNIAKRMSDDIKSVAHAEVYYNQMSKKEEKEYLKTLTKRERKEYKKQKKALKAAKAEEERLAAEEAARRAEEKRIQTIMDSIKNYESLINVINQYCNDAAVMARVNEKLDATLSDVYKNLGKSTRVTKAWLAFGKQLGAEDGEDAESFFSNLQSVISSFRDGIKDALYDIKDAFTEFTKSSEKVDMAKLFANNISQVRASTLFGQYIMQLANMGYNSQVIEYIGKQFSSDRASALEMMTQMIAATKQEITNMNNGISSLKNAMEKSMKLVDESVIRAQEDPEQAAFNQAQAAYQKAMREWEKFTKEDNFSIFDPKVSHEHHELEIMLSRARELNAELNKVESTTNSSNKANVRAKMYDEYKRQVEQIMKMTDLTTKQKVTAARELGKAYNITITSLKEYDRKIEDIRLQLTNLQSSGTASAFKSKEYEDLKRQLDKMIRERENSIAYQLDLLEKQYEAEKQAAEAAKNNAEAAYQEALNTWNAIQAERARLQREYELQTAFENALITITMGIKKWDDLTALMKANGWSADWLQRTYRKLNSALAPVNKAITLAKKNFSGWNGKSKSVLSELGAIEEGFLRLASTLEATNDETGAFIDDLGTRLEEYRKTLYDTIKGQVSLFDEFKKFSGEKATTANKYLDNMQSQINGVKEWLTNLEKLATMGVSGDVLKMFAEEGQGSFEKVAAFANATEEQIGELNAQYAEYMRLTEEAADRALATVGAAFSDGAIKMQDEMIAKFKASGAKRIADAAYEAGIMVVTGVKDGINAASPQIVYEIQGATQTINETLSKTLTSSAIEESIRKGLNTMSGALQNSVGVMVSDFLTSVTNTSVQKFKMAVDSCRAYVEATLPTDWNITIHVDTSEIDAAVARMNEAIAMTNFNAGQTSNTVTSSLANQQQTQVIGSQQPAAPNQTTVNYTQNNYSPKTLSRAEIYRQTQNQLSTITGVVNSANG